MSNTSINLGCVENIKIKDTSDMNTINFNNTTNVNFITTETNTKQKHPTYNQIRHINQTVDQGLSFERLCFPGTPILLQETVVVTYFVFDTLSPHLM